MKTFIIMLIISTSTFASAQDPEFKKFIDQMISEQKQEVKELESLRDEFVKKEGPKLDQDYVQLEQVLRDDFRKFTSRLRGKSIPETPKVEVQDEKAAYDVKVEVPGMNKEDVKVSVTDNNLIIKGIRRNEEKQNVNGNTSTEFTYGEFQRILRLNDKVDPKSMRVDFGNGIVHIHIKKLS